MTENLKDVTAVIGAGSVEYSAEDALVQIDELIAVLEEAKADGMQYVIMASGNYRGAQWQSFSTELGYLRDEDGD